jgi:hypothetical protein
VGRPEYTNIIFEGMLQQKINFHYNGQDVSKILLSKIDIYFYLKERLLNKGKSLGFLTNRELVFILGVKWVINLI